MRWVMRGLRTVCLGVDREMHSRLEANTALIVWWEDVCEDALTSKGLNTQLRVIGGGAANATDKVRLRRDHRGPTRGPPSLSFNTINLAAIVQGLSPLTLPRSSKTTPSAASTTSLASMPTPSAPSTSRAATASTRPSAMPPSRTSLLSTASAWAS